MSDATTDRPFYRRAVAAVKNACQIKPKPKPRQESRYHAPDRYDDAKHKRTIMSAEGVIDWDEAMEQCGDDEEFLRELLADLRGEVDQQVKKIDEMLTNVSGLDSTLLRRERRRGWVDGTTAVLEGSSDVETGKRTRFVWETCTYLELPTT